MNAPEDLDEVVEACRRCRPRAGDTRVIAVDGRSGAGKTTFTARLARALGHTDDVVIPVVHLDDLYPGWDGLDRTPELVRDQLLRPLAAGRPAGFRRWDWAADRPGDWQPVPATQILLLEGVGAGARVCAPYLALMIWLTAPEPERRRHALDRDGDRFAPHWDRWARQEEHYLARDDPENRADLRLRGLPAVERHEEPWTAPPPGSVSSET